MEPHEILKKLFEKFTAQLGEFVPVRQLSLEDVGKKRTLKFERDALRGEAKVLIAQLEAIKAKEDHLSAAFWEHLYKTYSLPRDHEYEINAETNQIMMQKKPDGDKNLCFCGECK